MAIEMFNARLTRDLDPGRAVVLATTYFRGPMASRGILLPLLGAGVPADNIN